MTSAIALFLFGGITAALSLQLPIGTLRVPGSGLFPLVLGTMLMGLAAAHAVQLHLLKSKAPSEAAAKPAGNGTTARVLRFSAAVVIATALLAPLGYTLMAFLLMLALLQSLGIRKWHVSGSIALVSAAVSYVIFVQWLKIPLPSGWPGF